MTDSVTPPKPKVTPTGVTVPSPLKYRKISFGNAELVDKQLVAGGSSAATPAQRVAAKKAIMENIGGKMNERFPARRLDEITERWGGSVVRGATHGETTASNLIEQWAYTSGDRDHRAIALQRAVQKEFGLDDVTMDALRKQNSANLLSENQFDKGLALFDEYEDELRFFVREQYNETQRWLKKRKRSSVTMFRGMVTKDAEWSTKGGAIKEYRLQPASSYSTDIFTAQNFTSEGAQRTIIAERIPADMILSNCKTGFGCLTEGEFTVLGGNHVGYVRDVSGITRVDKVPEFIADAKNTPGVAIAKSITKLVKAADLDQIEIPNLDENLTNADWTKSQFDLIETIQTTEELEEWIEAKGYTVAEVKKLPFYRLGRRDSGIIAGL